MLSLNNENINYVMTQNLKPRCVSFSYVSIRYVLAYFIDVYIVRSTASVVVCCCFEVSHMIFLMLRMKELLGKLSKFT